MKYVKVILLSLFSFVYFQNLAAALRDNLDALYITYKLGQNADADWLIIGAGPAGIATVGVLLDIGVSPDRITWLDPEFNVGRLSLYGNIPANSKTKEFIEFVTMCAAFREVSGDAVELLKQFDPTERGTELRYIVEPLTTITKHLCTQVKSIKGIMTTLCFSDGLWQVATSEGHHVSAQHVVLATGSKPRTLPYDQQKVIPLDSALDPHVLKTLVDVNDCVGVVGNAHSAVLLLKFLSELPVRHIYNFYRHPIVYAVDMGTWVLHPEGIKGVAAEWAKQVLEHALPANMTCIQVHDDKELCKQLEKCSKIIYAIGYDRNTLPAINGLHPIHSYNESNGMIAPRLFGIGIAFPEKVVNCMGHESYCIGLDCFMNYAQKLIPQWVTDDIFESTKRTQKYNAQKNVLKKMADLFAIHAL